jgi:hypothetical protein
MLRVGGSRFGAAVLEEPSPLRVHNWAITSRSSSTRLRGLGGDGGAVRLLVDGRVLDARHDPDRA